MFKKLFEKLNKKDDSNNSSNIEITTNSAFESQRRFYLNVPYNEKETAKKYGAKWHPGRKQWYILGDINIDDDNIVKWIDFEEKYNLYATSFFLAESKRYCWKCSKLTPVYAVLYDNYEYLSFDCDYERIGEKEIFVNEWLRDNEPFFAPLSDLTSSTIDQWHQLVIQ